MKNYKSLYLNLEGVLKIYSISKTAADDLDSNDFKSVLNQNESIHFDTADTYAMQECTAAAGFPKEWKTPRDLILPVDQNARALPRQIWIEFAPC